MLVSRLFYCIVVFLCQITLLAAPNEKAIRPVTLEDLPVVPGAFNANMVQDFRESNNHFPAGYFPQPPLAKSLDSLNASTCLRPLGVNGISMVRKDIDSVPFYIDAGHGGAGLTLAHGTSIHVIEMAEKDSTIRKVDPILVVGSGIVGMATVYQLIQRGYSNIHVHAEKWGPETPSNWAAGLWSAVSVVTGESSEEQRLMDQIQRRSFLEYTRMAKLGDKSGIYTLPIFVMENNPFNLSQPDKSGMKETAEAGIIPPGVSYDTLPIKNFRYGGMQYWTYSIDVPTQLAWLRSQIDPHVPQRQRKPIRYDNVQQIAQAAKEVGSDGKPATVFLCPGIGGKALLKGVIDNEIIAVKGVLLRQPFPAGLSPAKLSYMLFAGWLYFVVQKNQLIYGGTFLENNEDLSTSSTLPLCRDILASQLGLFQGTASPLSEESANWTPLNFFH